MLASIGGFRRHNIRETPQISVPTAADLRPPARIFSAFSPMILGLTALDSQLEVQRERRSR